MKLELKHVGCGGVFELWDITDVRPYIGLKCNKCGKGLEIETWKEIPEMIDNFLCGYYVGSIVGKKDGYIDGFGDGQVENIKGMI